MDFETQRRLMCQLGHRIWQRGWTPAHSGSFSRRLGEGLFLVTPAGASLGQLTTDMLVVVDEQGRPVAQVGPYRPTVDAPLHLACYRRRGDAGGVFCALPPATTAFSHTGGPLLAPQLDDLSATPSLVPLAPHDPLQPPHLSPGAQALLERHNALLLTGYAALTLDRDLERAYWRMEALEHAAQVQINMQLLGAVPHAH